MRPRCLHGPSIYTANATTTANSTISSSFSSTSSSSFSSSAAIDYDAAVDDVVEKRAVAQTAQLPSKTFVFGAFALVTHFPFFRRYFLVYLTVANLNVITYKMTSHDIT